MRELLTALVVLLVALIGWLAFRVEPELEAVSVGTEREDPVRVEVPVAELSATNSDESESVSATSPEREALETGREEVAATRANVPVTGTVLLHGSDGTTFAGESGLLRIVAEDDEPQTHEFAIHLGSFEFELPYRTLFEIDSIELGGKQCMLLVPAETVVLERALHLELEVQALAPATLIVRDRATGADLAGLELWNDAGWNLTPSLIPVSPSQQRIQTPNLASPISLPPRAGKQLWWVRSEGYEWGTVQFDHLSGGEQIVVLDREAVLSVHVENRAPGEALDVFLAKDTFAQRKHSLTVGGSEPSQFRVGGLPAGGCEVKVGRTRDKGGNRFAVSDVFLVAGEVTEARLTLPPLDRGDSGGTVLVSGTLELPPSNTQDPSRLKWLWKGDNPGPKQTHVTARFERIESETNRWTWETEELVPGPWQVSVTPFGHVEDLYIGPAGATDIALRIASLAEILIRVQDQDSGAPLPGSDVSYSRKGGTFDVYGGSAWQLDEPGVSRLLLAPGAYRLEAHAEGYDWDVKVITVGATDQEVLFGLKEMGRMTVVLKDGATVVPREMNWWLGVKAEHVGGEGYIASSMFSPDSASMSAGVSEPGLYRLTFGEVDGYLPIEPLEVLLEPGLKEIVIQLVRE